MAPVIPIPSQAWDMPARPCKFKAAAAGPGDLGLQLSLHPPDEDRGPLWLEDWAAPHPGV